MKVPSKSDLMHYQLQALMRENTFDEEQMKYLGLRDDGKHWYLFGGIHEVSSDQFEEIELVEGIE
jgi:hypothetical protein